MSLVEVLVAAAIFAVVCFCVLGLVHEFSLSGRRFATEQRSHADVAHLLELWQSDESSSDAIFVPRKDVFGNDNATKPHEVDFYAKDASNRPYFWAYLWDSAAQTVQRYDYGSGGGTPQKDGPLYPDIVQFAPSVHALSEVASPSSAIYMPVFASAQDYDVPLGIAPGVVGGTHVVHVDLATSSESVPVELTTAGAPSGFTVVLNYTPAPKAPSPLIVEPAAVQLATGGSAIAAAKVRPAVNVASILNAMLGGGIANAAGSCVARAYNDAGFTQPVQPGTQVGTDIGVTDASGCFPGALYIHETGYRNAFIVGGSMSCGGSISLGPWKPSVNGPTTTLQATGVTMISSCSIPISDRNTQSQQQVVAAQVLQACVGSQVRESDSNCAALSETLSNADSDVGATCDYSGGQTQETIITYTYSTLAGSGVTITPDGSGSATVVGSAPGSPVVKESYHKEILGSAGIRPCRTVVLSSIFQHQKINFQVYPDLRLREAGSSGWLAGP